MRARSEKRFWVDLAKAGSPHFFVIKTTQELKRQAPHHLGGIIATTTTRNKNNNSHSVTQSRK